jgi:hypothetical protein
VERVVSERSLVSLGVQAKEGKMLNRIDQEFFRAQLKNEKFIAEKREASPEVVKVLPANRKILAYVLSPDIAGKETEAMIVLFSDQSGNRVAHFRLDTGAYMDDFIL